MENYCESTAGVVTAANEYFILSADETQRRRLTPWARKILKKGSYLPRGPVFSKQDFLRISETEPCNLIDFYLEDAPGLSKAAKLFIEECEEKELHKRYKCRRRKPWFRIPIVEAGDGLFFKRAHILPRLCVNEAKILATDTAYQIRMKDSFRIEDLCFSFYNSFTLLFAEVDGRFYGGGVLELTPEEFRGLPICFVRPTDAEFATFATHLTVSGSNGATAVEFGDSYIRQELGITEEQMSNLRDALFALREHRMRHAASRYNYVHLLEHGG